MPAPAGEPVGLRRLNTGRVLADVGWQATLVVGIWGQAAFVLGANAGALAGVTASMTLGWLFGALASGRIIDRYGPRKVMVACQLLIAPSVLFLAGVPSTTTLFLLVGLLSLLRAPSHMALASMAPHLTIEKRDFQRINGSLEIAGTAATILGAGAGALIARLADLSWIFVFHSLLALAAAVAIAGIRTLPLDRPSRRRRRRLDGLRTVYADRTLVRCLLASMTVWLTMSVFETLQPLIIRDRLGAEADALGWLHIVYAIGLVVGSSLVGSRLSRRVSPRTVPLWMASLGLGVILFTSGGLGGAVIGLLIAGCSLGAFEPLLRTVIQSRVKREQIGRVVSILEVHDQLAELAPLALLAGVTAALGVPVVLVACGMGVAAVGLVAGRVGRVRRN